MGQYLQFLVRFLVGGLLIGAVPIVANRFGGQYAGIVLLFPMVTLTGFIFIALRSGGGVMQAAAEGSLKALPTVVIFLTAVYLVSRLGAPPATSLAVGLAGWVITAIILVALKLV